MKVQTLNVHIENNERRKSLFIKKNKNKGKNNQQEEINNILD